MPRRSTWDHDEQTPSPDRRSLLARELGSVLGRPTGCAAVRRGHGQRHRGRPGAGPGRGPCLRGSRWIGRHEDRGRLTCAMAGVGRRGHGAREDAMEEPREPASSADAPAVREGQSLDDDADDIVKERSGKAPPPSSPLMAKELAEVKQAVGRLSRDQLAARTSWRRVAVDRAYEPCDTSNDTEGLFALSAPATVCPSSSRAVSPIDEGGHPGPRSR